MTQKSFCEKYRKIELDIHMYVHIFNLSLSWLGRQERKLEIIKLISSEFNLANQADRNQERT